MTDERLDGYIYAKQYHQETLKESSDEEIEFLINKFTIEFEQNKKMNALGMADYYREYLDERRKRGNR